MTDVSKELLPQPAPADVVERVAVALEREFPECIDEGRMGFILRLAKAAVSAMGVSYEVERLRSVLERRRNIYLAKRDMFDALGENTETPWERYDFAVEAVEWVAGDLGIKLPERPDDARQADGRRTHAR